MAAQEMLEIKEYCATSIYLGQAAAEYVLESPIAQINWNIHHILGMHLALSLAVLLIAIDLRDTTSIGARGLLARHGNGVRWCRLPKKKNI